jgi:glycerol uptake facilitator-like aquaporin
VTLAALRKIRWAEAAVYIVMQLLGAVAGALLVKLLLDDEGSPASYGGVAAGDPIDGSSGLALLTELIGTFMLMWAIMGMAVNPRGDRNFAPLVIGSTLGFAVLMTGPLTGAGLNPARAFGPNLVGGTLDPFGDFVLAFVLGPLLGALIAGFGYRALVLRDEASSPEARGPTHRQTRVVRGFDVAGPHALGVP